MGIDMTITLADCQAVFADDYEHLFRLACSRVRLLAEDTGETALENDDTPRPRAAIVDVENAASDTLAIAWRRLASHVMRFNTGAFDMKDPTPKKLVYNTVCFAARRVITGRRVTCVDYQGQKLDCPMNLRHAARRVELDSVACERAIERQSASRVVDSIAVQYDVFHAIDKIPSNRLHDVAEDMAKGRTQREIATRHNLSKGAVTTICKAARVALRTILVAQ